MKSEKFLLQGDELIPIIIGLNISDSLEIAIHDTNFRDFCKGALFKPLVWLLESGPQLNNTIGISIINLIEFNSLYLLVSKFVTSEGATGSEPYRIQERNIFRDDLTETIDTKYS